MSMPCFGYLAVLCGSRTVINHDSVFRRPSAGGLLINSCSLFSMHDCLVSGSTRVQAQSTQFSKNRWPCVVFVHVLRAPAVNQVLKQAAMCTYSFVSFSAIQQKSFSTCFLLSSFRPLVWGFLIVWRRRCCSTLMKPAVRSYRWISF